jgi:hypothetical protein
LCIDYRKWLEWQDFTGTARPKPNVGIHRAMKPQAKTSGKKQAPGKRHKGQKSNMSKKAL